MLLEGASEGTGLGTHFLKHVERCAVLIHLIDVTAEDVVESYRIIRHELEQYGHKLATKKEIIALNKIDSLTAEDIQEKQTALEKQTGSKIYTISGIAHTGVVDLLREVVRYIPKRNNDDTTEEE